MDLFVPYFAKVLSLSTTRVMVQIGLVRCDAHGHRLMRCDAYGHRLVRRDAYGHRLARCDACDHRLVRCDAHGHRTFHGVVFLDQFKGSFSGLKRSNEMHSTPTHACHVAVLAHANVA